MNANTAPQNPVFQGYWGDLGGQTYDYGHYSRMAASWPQFPTPTPVGGVVPLPTLLNHWPASLYTPQSLGQLVVPCASGLSPFPTAPPPLPTEPDEPFMPGRLYTGMPGTLRPRVSRNRSTPYPGATGATTKRPRRGRKVITLATTPVAPAPLPTFAQPLDPVNLVPRPSEWRPDYKPSNSSRGLSRRFTQSLRNAIGGKRDYKLTPLLEYTSSLMHPIGYDIRLDPMESDIQFLNMLRPSNNLDYLQLATYPPQREMCLWHPHLPWYIYIRESHDNGITIQDILCQIYAQLTSRIRHQDLYNEVLDSRSREGLSTAYFYRCNNNVDDLCNGVLRMDFLGFDVVFLGLAKSSNGMWEMKTREADP